MAPEIAASVDVVMLRVGSCSPVSSAMGRQRAVET